MIRKTLIILYFVFPLFCIQNSIASPTQVGTVIDAMQKISGTTDYPFEPVGNHIIAEFLYCKNLSNHEQLETVLRSAAQRANATILSVTTHQFEPDLFDVAGMTGVAVLLESHISVHTWPEYDYASIDVYTCRNISVEKALEVLQEFFQPKKVRAITITRGFEK